MKFLHKKFIAADDVDDKRYSAMHPKNKISLNYLLHQAMIWGIIGFLIVIIVKRFIIP